MRAFIALLAFALVSCRSAGPPPAAAGGSADNRELTRQIVAQLDRAAADWNRGDLDAFVSDYAPESTTTFVDGRRARHGFDFIRNNYAPRFAPGARRDSLHFEEVETRSLSPNLALVTARYIALHPPARRDRQCERPLYPGDGAENRRLEDPPRSLFQ